MSNLMLRFTANARNSLSAAQREAELEQATLIEVRHLLAGLAQLPPGESTAAHVLNELGVTTDKLRALGQNGSREASAKLDLSDGVKKTLERAAAAAHKRGDKKLASAHLLAGSLEDEATAQILEQAGTSLERVRSALDSLDLWTDEA
ncbi:MAG: hypothetical protein IT320_21620 [Anaerolineae bacterium]|nr:hypothetical protein [Anaerolineae bacterium]